MKLSCLPVSFFADLRGGRMTLREWAQMGAELGLDAIDISVMLLEDHTPKYLRRINADFAAARMSVSMVTTYPDFTHPDRRQRERELEYLRRDIAVSAQLGAHFLRITAGQAHPEMGTAEGIRLAVEHIRAAATVAERHGVTLLFENHSKPGAWDFADFSHPTLIFLEIAERIRDAGVRINFDTANTLVYGDDPIPVMASVFDQISTVHVADIAAKGRLEPVVIGTGIVPIREMLSILKARDFDGWIAIEEASGTGRAGVAKAIEFVRTTWHEVSGMQGPLTKETACTCV